MKLEKFDIGILVGVLSCFALFIIAFGLLWSTTNTNIFVDQIYEQKHRIDQINLLIPKLPEPIKECKKYCKG